MVKWINYGLFTGGEGYAVMRISHLQFCMRREKPGTKEGFLGDCICIKCKSRKTNRGAEVRAEILGQDSSLVWEESDDAVYPGRSSGDNPLRSVYFVPVSETSTEPLPRWEEPCSCGRTNKGAASYYKRSRQASWRRCHPSYILKGETEVAGQGHSKADKNYPAQAVMPSW